MAEQQKTMATDFWKSGHCRHFLLEQRVADASNPKDLNTGLTMQQLRLVKGYFVDALAGAVLHFAKDRETSLFSRQRTIATSRPRFSTACAKACLKTCLEIRACSGIRTRLKCVPPPAVGVEVI